MLNADDINALKDVFPFFKQLDPAQEDAVTRNAYTKDYHASQVIMSRKNECNGVIVVLSGQLRAYIMSEDGKEITLYRLLSDDVCIMTASCAIKNINFDMTLDVEKDAHLIFIPAHVWSNLSDTNITVKEYSLQLVSSRFSEVMWIMEQVVFKGMGQRIAAFLLELSALEDSDTLHITHEMVAKNLGTAREVVSRMLKYFENEGFIALSRSAVKILDFKKLHSVSI